MDARRGALALLLMAFACWFAVRKIGLAKHDVALCVAVGGYAALERYRNIGRTELLGEEAGEQLRWWDFMCEHHQLLGCVVRGKKTRRSRSERFLSLAITTLALLYWKAFFRPPPVRMKSLEGLRSSLWTLLVSKGVQQVMKRTIRFFAGRTAAWQASARWSEALQLQWQISQYWTLGFMMLCVILALLEGRNWVHLLSGWLINMAFALTVFELVFTYIKFKLLAGYLQTRRVALQISGRARRVSH